MSPSPAEYQAEHAPAGVMELFVRRCYYLAVDGVNAVPFAPTTLVDIYELRSEAAEARCLAVKFKDRETVSDLLNYAAALEIDANKFEQALEHCASALSSENSRRAVWANHSASARH